VVAVERRVIRFDLAAYEGERKLGEGQHARALVDVAKFNTRLGTS
jgi:fluoroacetyl-CoA thioesterase